jgi:hypothetical protein
MISLEALLGKTRSIRKGFVNIGSYVFNEIGRYLIKRDQPPLILIESNQVPLNELALSRFLPHLGEKVEYEYLSYRMDRGRLWSPIVSWFRHCNSFLFSIGCRRYTYLNGTVFLWNLGKAKKLLDQIKSKEELENLEVCGIHIGDLIYDRCLSWNRSATISLSSKELLKTVAECLSYFDYWTAFFRKNRVSAVCISHCVYHFAIPARIAASQGIPSYEVTATHIFRVDSENIHATVSPKNLNKISELAQKESLEDVLGIGKQARIDYFKPNDFGNPNLRSVHDSHLLPAPKLIRDGERAKVMVASHLLFDAPHRFGIALYPDFYEWLIALGKLSENLNFDWYIKEHPDTPEDRKFVLEDFVQIFDKFTLIPATYSHKRMVEEGIDLVLTAHGSVGFEYPALGVPVISANPNSAYSYFGFANCPSSRQEYEEMITKFKNLDLKIDTDELDRFFYSRSLTGSRNWIFDDYGKFMKDIGGMSKSMSSDVYSYANQSDNFLTVASTSTFVKNYLLSGEQFAGHQHAT